VQYPALEVELYSQLHAPEVESAFVHAAPIALVRWAGADSWAQNPMSVWQTNDVPRLEQSEFFWQEPWQKPIPSTVPLDVSSHVYATHVSLPTQPVGFDPFAGRLQRGMQVPCPA
jgi:hypothetical protein